MKHSLFVFTLIALIILHLSCGRKATMDYKLKYQTEGDIQNLLSIMPEYPEVKFAVFSDSHLYDISLGISGEAYQSYIDDDRKLLHLSREILGETVKKIRSDKPDFILVPGDLTKDGEKINHELFSKEMDSLSDVVPSIYVVPGNHDVNNSGAVRFNGAVKEQVETVTPDEFRKIHLKQGYDKPLEADKTSLSYVAEPVKGLWVLALDSCLWRDNKKGEHSHTDGEFSEATLRWIEEILIKSKVERKALIAFMHHGLIEHYPDNEKYYGQYVVNNSDHISKMFAAYGVKVVFTGHYHAQDITVKKTETPGRFVYDIETGSLVTYPSPYRIITIGKDQKMHVRSRTITNIPSMKDGFKDYSSDFLFNGTVNMANTALRKYKVSEDDLKVLSPVIARAYVTHLSGDEIKPDKYLPGEGLGLMGKIVMKVKGGLLEGWYTDLAPADNDIEIDLKTGDSVKSAAAK